MNNLSSDPLKTSNLPNEQTTPSTQLQQQHFPDNHKDKSINTVSPADVLPADLQLESPAKTEDLLPAASTSVTSQQLPVQEVSAESKTSALLLERLANFIFTLVYTMLAYFGSEKAKAAPSRGAPATRQDIIPPSYYYQPPAVSNVSQTSPTSNLPMSSNNSGLFNNTAWGVPYSPLVKTPEVPSTQGLVKEAPDQTSQVSASSDPFGSRTPVGTANNSTTVTRGLHSSSMNINPTSGRQISITGRESLMSSQFVNAYQTERDMEHSLPGHQVDSFTTYPSYASAASASFFHSQASEQQTTQMSYHHHLPTNADASKHPYDMSEMQRMLSHTEPAADESKNTLVIKNLPFKFKQADLDKILADNNARPKNVRLLRDDAGRFTGIAFVRCPSKDEAAKLIANMNGMDVGGRAIQVEFKKKKSKKKQLQQQQKGLSSSGNSFLSSSGDSDRHSLSSDDELLSSSSSSHHVALSSAYAKRLAYSDEMSNYRGPEVPTRYLQPPQTSTIPPTTVYSPYAPIGSEYQQQQQVKRLSISDEHTITDKYLRKTPQFVTPAPPGFSQQPQHQSLFSHSPYMGAQQSASSYQQQYLQQQQLLQAQQLQQQQQHYEHFPSAPQGSQPPLTPRRKSMSQVEGAHPVSRPSAPRSLMHSAEHPNSAFVHPGTSLLDRIGHSSAVRPLRQPLGPDGNSKGFPPDYQLSRAPSMSRESLSSRNSASSSLLRSSNAFVH